MVNLLTPEEVAEQLQLSPATIRRYCATGQLEAKKFGRAWRIPSDAFDAWLEACTFRVPPGTLKPEPRKRPLRAVESGGGRW